MQTTAFTSNYSRKPRRRFDFKGDRIDKLDWQGMEIVPVQKDFYVEHLNKTT